MSRTNDDLDDFPSPKPHTQKKMLASKCKEKKIKQLNVVKRARKLLRTKRGRLDR